MIKPLLEINQFSLNYGQKSVLKDLNWTINRAENWLLCGESGSGKSALLKAIAGISKSNDNIVRHINTAKNNQQKAIHYVAQWYQFTNIEGVANFYYQQRYNLQQQKETVSVKVELEHFGNTHALANKELLPILTALGFTEKMEQQLLELSSGEHKKLQLVKALWLKPQLLLLDQPYTGLDSVSRHQLNLLLDQICGNNVQLILVSSEAEVPACINRFANLCNGSLEELYSICTRTKSQINTKPIPEFLQKMPTSMHEVLVRMDNINIHYGEKQALKNINWELANGEKWLLSGPNGSGKSTLLSLINGDHPQAYANELYLFGQKRGTGESIWDIKSRIGMISPEMHWYFDFNTSLWQSIASGFFDSIGLYQQISWHKRKQVDEIIAFFGLEKHQNELLGHLPLGIQRMALLARTLIKNPELLVLDEPCQGLDRQQTQQFNNLIDELCKTQRSLIYVSHSDEDLPKNFSHHLILEKGELSYKGKYLRKEELETVS